MLWLTFETDCFASRGMQLDLFSPLDLTNITPPCKNSHIVHSKYTSRRLFPCIFFLHLVATSQYPSIISFHYIGCLWSTADFSSPSVFKTTNSSWCHTLLLKGSALHAGKFGIIQAAQLHLWAFKSQALSKLKHTSLQFTKQSIFTAWFSTNLEW